MVYTHRLCPPSSLQATLAISITATVPTISLSSLFINPSLPILTLHIHIRCVSSTQPHNPLTLLTSGVLVPNKPNDGAMDCLALGAFGAGLVCSTGNAVNGKRKVISLGNFRIHRARQDGNEAVDLRERPNSEFISVPAQDSGEDVVVTHQLSAERLFAFADNIAPGDLVVGEKYDLRLRKDHVGTGWWCWGSLDGELKRRGLHAFSEGRHFGVKRPSEEEMEREGWVLGENVTHLRFEVGDDVAMCTLEIVV